MKGYMYILECSDGSYYTGSTNNLDLRLKQHDAGDGANHTKKHLPVKLVYYEEFDRIDSAFYREKQVQGWSRKKKEALIAGFQDKLPELSLAYRDLLSVAEALEATQQYEATIIKKYQNYTMKIIITNPTALKNEAELINTLFDNGLELLHVRKPEYSSQELVLLLQEINPIHYSKIALHSCHFLAKSFGINRLHYNETSRKQLTDADFKEFKNDGLILSTSIHSVEDYNLLSDHFSYAFLSPVFDSISKADYEAKQFDLSLRKKTSTKLIALGGITENNCTKAFEMGFDGVAMMGSVWNSEDKIKRFKNVSQKYADNYFSQSLAEK
jgi:thiamine-phosphate pyrophosphorylase